MTKKLKAALLVDKEDFNPANDFADFNKVENIDLRILVKGQGRREFLSKAKDLLLNNIDNKEFTEDDIRALEEELDLVINISKAMSLEDSLVTGLNYAEIVFVEKDLEDFVLEDYKAAVEEFRKRGRNFGA